MSKNSFTREHAWGLAGASIGLVGCALLLEIESERSPDPYSRESVAFAIGYLAIALGAWLTVQAVRFLVRVIAR